MNMHCEWTVPRKRNINRPFILLFEKIPSFVHKKMVLKLLRCQFLLTKLVKIHKVDNDPKVSINEAVWSNTSFLTMLAGGNESSCNLWSFA